MSYASYMYQHKSTNYESSIASTVAQILRFARSNHQLCPDICDTASWVLQEWACYVLPAGQNELIDLIGPAASKAHCRRKWHQRRGICGLSIGPLHLPWPPRRIMHCPHLSIFDCGTSHLILACQVKPEFHVRSESYHGPLRCCGYHFLAGRRCWTQGSPGPNLPPLQLFPAAPGS